MRTTVDRAGRIVLPKALRDQVGIVAGEVEVTQRGEVVDPATARGPIRIRRREA